MADRLETARQAVYFRLRIAVADHRLDPLFLRFDNYVGCVFEIAEAKASAIISLANLFESA